MNRVILVKPWVYVFCLGKLLDFCQKTWILEGGRKSLLNPDPSIYQIS